jgi:CheY-like chemotaxis protein
MKKTVLVVDDDDDVRWLHRRQLTSRGYRVLEASSLGEAYGKLANAPDAIVLDLELPDGKSTTLLDRLARDSAAPPVVLCTSSAHGGRVAQRYHIPSLGKLAVAAVGKEVDRALARGDRPRVSQRPSATSRPSLA